MLSFTATSWSKFHHKKYLKLMNSVFEKLIKTEKFISISRQKISVGKSTMAKMRTRKGLQNYWLILIKYLLYFLKQPLTRKELDMHIFNAKSQILLHFLIMLLRRIVWNGMGKFTNLSDILFKHQILTKLLKKHLNILLREVFIVGLGFIDVGDVC